MSAMYSNDVWQNSSCHNPDLWAKYFTAKVDASPSEFWKFLFLQLCQIAETLRNYCSCLSCAELLHVFCCNLFLVSSQQLKYLNHSSGKFNGFFKTHLSNEISNKKPNGKAIRLSKTPLSKQQKFQDLYSK